MSNQVRIIAGRWRGRKLTFPDVPGLRPTPDRVRETLFNWLQYDVIGSRCLDLFAGSGGLGFEAASREAAHVVQVETNHQACRSLETHIRTLGADSRISVIKGDVLKFLAGSPQVFDLVFLDPPFGFNLVSPVCLALEENGWLAEEAKIYVEAESGTVLSGMPQNWEELKSKTAGDVGYRLYRRRRSIGTDAA
ncbi:MAG: 16S rRNA (guanine(966)-N(2))-methyltransferase RsmD [Pseudomonadota bacterium]